MRLRFLVIALLAASGVVGFVPTIQAANLVIDRVTVAEEPKTTQGGVTKITWYTNIEADGRIDYGTSASYGSYIGSSLSPRLFHEIILAGLKSETTYHFKIISATPLGQRTESFDQTFKTSKFKETTPVAISNGVVQHIGGSYFILTWQTDRPSDSNVEYSLDRNMSRPGRAGGAGNATIHEVVVKGLKPNTVYWYQAKSRDKDKNEGVWGPFIVTTAPSQAEEKEPLLITLVSPVSSPDPLIGASSVTFRWRTSRPARGWVDLRSQKKGGKKVNETGFYQVEHELTVTGLVANTTYTVKLQGTDIFNKSVTSGEIFLTTAASIPGASSGLDCTKTYAYGAACRDLSAERNLASILRASLQQVFRGRTPSSAKQNWYTLVKAYVYGGYPLEAIVKAVKFGGKTVHPTIPWSQWMESAEYKEYIGK